MFAFYNKERNTFIKLNTWNNFDEVVYDLYEDKEFGQVFVLTDKDAMMKILNRYNGKPVMGQRGGVYSPEVEPGLLDGFEIVTLTIDKD